MEVDTPGGEPTDLDAFPVVFNPNFFAVDVFKIQVLSLPFVTNSLFLTLIPSPSNGFDPSPLLIAGSSIIVTSLLNICFPKLSFRKLVPLAIEVPDIELARSVSYTHLTLPTTVIV